MPRIRCVVPLLVSTALLVGLVLPSVGSANSPAATIQINNQALLLAPTDVQLTVHYSCAPPTPGYIRGSVTQSTANFTTGGGIGVATALCDNQVHQTTIDVCCGPFVPGQAVADAFIVNGDVTATADTGPILIKIQ